MNEFGLFAQDSWRVTPTLTLNYGVRWEVQLPFTPLTNTWSNATMADFCGVSGEGDGVGGRQCNLFQPGSTCAANGVPPVRQVRSGQPRLQHGLQQLRAERRRRLAAERRRTACSGRLLGDPEQATVRGGYSVAFNRERMDRFTGLYGGNVGGTTTAQPQRHHRLPARVGPGESWPLLIARLEPARAASVPDVADVSDPRFDRRWQRHQHLRPERPDAVHRVVDGRLPALARHGHGGRGPLRRQPQRQGLDDGELERPEHLRERLPRTSSSAAQANLRSHITSGCGGTANPCSFAYRGPGTGTSPLPTYLAFFSARPSQAATGELHVDQLHEQRLDRAPLASSSRIRWTPRTTCGTTPGAARTRAADGIPANFFVLNPAVDDANVTRSEAGSRYHSLQMDLRRRLDRRAHDTGQLHVRAALGLDARGSAPRSDLPADRQRAARLQAQLGLRDPDRARPTVRHEHEQVAQRRARRLGVHRRRTRPGPLLRRSAASGWSG